MIRELNEKEKAMMKHMRKNGRITSGEVQRMLEVSRGTANKYLTKLLSLKLIERLGEGKSTFYVLR